MAKITRKRSVVFIYLFGHMKGAGFGVPVLPLSQGSAWERKGFGGLTYPVSGWVDRSLRQAGDRLEESAGEEPLGFSHPLALLRRVGFRLSYVHPQLPGGAFALLRCSYGGKGICNVQRKFYGHVSEQTETIDSKPSCHHPSVHAKSLVVRRRRPSPTPGFTELLTVVLVADRGWRRS
ncbi:Hypothetical predicted protein [Podarcis lilfordi]|uniref:Uncharacterized protein n=1 Tax=Podarcis lilfordi TaxID=74358 RepID=A0AA35K400_9SAUR|nr:Hypothetical predicted protein [Podarcis lilfordi]